MLNPIDHSILKHIYSCEYHPTVSDLETAFPGISVRNRLYSLINRSYLEQTNHRSVGYKPTRHAVIYLIESQAETHKTEPCKFS